MNRYEVEELIIGMAELVHENRALRKRIEEYRIESSINGARLWGKKELVEKLEKRQTENLGYNLAGSAGWRSSDEFGTIDDMDLTAEEYDFCCRRN